MSDLTKEEQITVIEWITCDGQAQGIMEEELGTNVSADAVEEFIALCGSVLLDHLSNNEM